MRRPAAWAASAILAATILTGCGGGDGDDFCSKAEELSSLNGSEDMSAEDVQASLDELIDSAPDEVKDDLEVLQDALDDPASTDAASLEEATNNLGTYAQDECGIDING